MKIGTIRVRDRIAIVEPRTVSFRASWARPSSKSSWPGRIPSPVSESGAPRKIVGMKSRNVWVIARVVMKMIRIVGDRL